MKIKISIFILIFIAVFGIFGIQCSAKQDDQLSKQLIHDDQNESETTILPDSTGNTFVEITHNGKTAKAEVFDAETIEDIIHLVMQNTNKWTLKKFYNVHTGHYERIEYDKKSGEELTYPIYFTISQWRDDPNEFLFSSWTLNLHSISGCRTIDISNNPEEQNVVTKYTKGVDNTFEYTDYSDDSEFDEKLIEYLNEKYDHCEVTQGQYGVDYFYQLAEQEDTTGTDDPYQSLNYLTKYIKITHVIGEDGNIHSKITACYQTESVL